MRDPARVRRITALIQELWEQRPDLRYFQLISWLEHEYSKQNNLFDKGDLIDKDEKNFEMPIDAVDLFHLEDDKLERFLKQMIKG
jgi:hypothetical protein